MRAGVRSLVRFLQTGDWQLGMTRHFLGDEAQARFTEARFGAIRRMARLASEQGCEFAVVCGDVFESNQVDRRTVARALEALAEMSVPVYLLPGNHDPLDGASVYRSRGFRERVPENVYVLEDERPVAIRAGVELVGAPWSAKRVDADLVARTCASLDPRPGTTRIVAAHGAVDALSPNRDDPAAIGLAAAESLLAEGRIHYLALGDRHSLTAVGESGRIWYAGAPEPTDFDEVGPGHALVVELDDERAHVVPHHVATWQFVRRGGIAADGEEDLDALEEWLGGFECKERVVLKLGLEGSLDLRGAARLEAILEHGRDLFAALERWDRETRLAVRPADGDFDHLALSGFARSSVERLRAQASGEVAEAGVARDALALLVRLAGASEAAA